MHSHGHSHIRGVAARNTGGSMHGRHSHAQAPTWLIILGIIFTLTTFGLGIFFWRLSGGSVAILADSLHSLFHTALWSIGLWANLKSNRRRDARAGLAMGAIIFGTGLFIGVSGILNILYPAEVISSHMIIIALIALTSELIQAILMYVVKHRDVRVRKIIRVKILLRDNLIDIFASLGVLLGGAVIFTTGFYRADGIAAIFIALAAFYLARETIRESLDELTELNVTELYERHVPHNHTH